MRVTYIQNGDTALGQPSKTHNVQWANYTYATSSETNKQAYLLTVSSDTVGLHHNIFTKHA